MVRKNNFIVEDEEELFHYTSSDGLLGILRSNTLWFTDYSVLNDESEGRYVFDMAKKVIKENPIYDKVYIDIALPAIGRNLTSRCFICSFSRNSDSLPLWSNYSKNVSKFGYNFSLKVSDLKRSINKNTFLTNPSVVVDSIVYNEEDQKKIIKSVIDKFYKAWLKGTSKSAIQEFLSADLRLWRFKFKHSAFESEDEVRAYIHISDEEFSTLLRGKEDVIKFRSINGIFAPYIEVPIDINSIGQITLSPMLKGVEAGNSVAFLCEKYGLRCKIKHSEIPLRY